MSSTRRPVAVSRLPVGWSAKITFGLFTRARAITTRCFCPPERLMALFFALSASSSCSMCRHPAALRSFRANPGDLQRQNHVVEHRRVGGEEELLKDEAEVFIADAVHNGILELFRIRALDQQHPAIGIVEQREQMHQRRLARAALADDGDRLPGRDLERHPFQGVEPAGAMAVGLVDVWGHQHGEQPHRSGPLTQIRSRAHHPSVQSTIARRAGFRLEAATDSPTSFSESRPSRLERSPAR